MARIAEGWALVWRRGIARVRFTHQGKRYEITTGQRDPVTAAEVGARIYADVISGRVRQVKGGALIHPSTELDGLCADWLAAIESQLGEDTGGTFECYARHWCSAMATVSGLSARGIGEYQRSRLAVVTRSTVVKELSALRNLIGWLVEQGMLAEAPLFPSLPKKATGVRHKQGRRRPDGVRMPEEVELILSKLSDRTRPFFEALWETGLRPRSTLERLLPGDLTPFGLHIRAECDKNRWERTVPISDRARAALTALPFGRKDRREAWANAVDKALPGERVTPYDLKHARVTLWIHEGRPLDGISFRTGVSLKTLMERYAHATRRSAEWGPAPERKLAMPVPALLEPARATGTEGNDDSHLLEVLAAERSCGFKSRPSHSSTETRAPLRPQNLPAVVRVALFGRALPARRQP